MSTQIKYKRKTRDIWQLITNYGYGNEVEIQSDDYMSIKEDYLSYKKEKDAGFLPDLLVLKIQKRRVYV